MELKNTAFSHAVLDTVLLSSNPNSQLVSDRKRQFVSQQREGDGIRVNFLSHTTITRGTQPPLLRQTFH